MCPTMMDLGSPICVVMTEASILEQHGRICPKRYLVFLGRIANGAMTERLMLVIDSHDQVRDLIGIATPSYVDVWVGASEDHDEILASLLRPRPPGSLIDLDAIKREADRVVNHMMKKGDDHGS